MEFIPSYFFLAAVLEGGYYVQLTAKLVILFVLCEAGVTEESFALYGQTIGSLEILAKAPINILKSNTRAHERVSLKILIWQHCCAVVVLRQHCRAVYSMC